MAKQSGIFFIRNDQGMTRIARTRDLTKRMSEWQAASPFPIRVTAKITMPVIRGLVTSNIRRSRDARTRTKTSTPYEQDPSEATVLAELHRHFSGCRVHGDWYILDEAEFQDLYLEDTRPVEELAGLVDRAETVWRAVDYARAQSPEGQQLWAEDLWGHSWGNVMRSHLIAWLVEHGRQDLSVVLRFRKEFKFLTWLAMSARESYGIPCGLMTEEYVCWSMMQGAASFKASLYNPRILSLTPEFNHWANHAHSALKELTKGTELADQRLCLLRQCEGRIMGGARIEDFSGWDVARAVAEFSG